ncbi:MAG: hypothetical protein ACWGO1_10500, partial [Anaerolineales bacterium]
MDLYTLQLNDWDKPLFKIETSNKPVLALFDPLTKQTKQIFAAPQEYSYSTVDVLFGTPEDEWIVVAFGYVESSSDLLKTDLYKVNILSGE